MHILRATTGELSACKDLQSEALFVMPCTDMPMARRAAAQMAQRAGAPGHLLLLEDLHGWGFIRIVNHVFKATQGRHFGYVAQDAFAGRQWLSLALEALDRRWPGDFPGAAEMRDAVQISRGQ